MSKEPCKYTICQSLEILYSKAIADNRLGDAGIIQECYIMAKKMNRKLLEYKYGDNIPAGEDSPESDWLRSLDQALERYSNGRITRNSVARKL